MSVQETCSVDECENKVRARGWCAGHWSKWKRHGSPSAKTRRQYATPGATFAARTEMRGDCLEWTGGLMAGYGRLFVDGRAVRAHRYAWERANGPIPDGMVVDHICHNPSCVKVDHLRVATVAQNSANRAGADSRNKSGHRNVYWRERDKSWSVEVTHRGTKYRAHFKELGPAVEAAQQMRAEILGQFAGRG